MSTDPPTEFHLHRWTNKERTWVVAVPKHKQSPICGTDRCVPMVAQRADEVAPVALDGKPVGWVDKEAITLMMAKGLWEATGLDEPATYCP